MPLLLITTEALAKRDDYSDAILVTSQALTPQAMREIRDAWAVFEKHGVKVDRLPAPVDEKKGGAQ